MKLLPSPLVCRDAVELVSDYLDGTLSRRQRDVSKSTWPSATRAAPTSIRCARPSRERHGRSRGPPERGRRGPRQPVPSIPSRRVKGPHGFV